MLALSASSNKILNIENIVICTSLVYRDGISLSTLLPLSPHILACSQIETLRTISTRTDYFFQPWLSRWFPYLSGFCNTFVLSLFTETRAWGADSDWLHHIYIYLIHLALTYTYIIMLKCFWIGDYFYDSSIINWNHFVKIIHNW